MIKRVDFVCIPVIDQDKAVWFYTQKLGFSIHTDEPMWPGERWIELSIPGADTRVVIAPPVSGNGHKGTFLNLSFFTDDIQQTYRELSAKGVAFRGPPIRDRWGWSLMLEDPDGNTIHVAQHAPRG